MKWSMTEPGFFKGFFCLKHRENGSKLSQKWDLFEFIKKLVFDFHWICSITKTYIICCVSVHNLYLIEILFLGYGPNFLCQSDCSIYKIMISLEQINEIAWFFAFWHQLKKTKSWSVILLDGNGQKWVYSIWLQDSKIECISRMSSWNKLIFCMMLQIEES